MKADTMTTETTRAVVADYVAALQRGDIDALRASFAPDATWWLRGDLPTARTWTGADEILDGFLAAMTARLDTSKPLTQELKHVIADGDLAVAEWTSRAGKADEQDRKGREITEGEKAREGDGAQGQRPEDAGEGLQGVPQAAVEALRRTMNAPVVDVRRACVVRRPPYLAVAFAQSSVCRRRRVPSSRVTGDPGGTHC
jgi:uncharacterized protein